MLNACVKCVSRNFADAGASFNHCFDASCKMQMAAKVFLKNEESRNRCEETCLKVKGFLPMQNAVKKNTADIVITGSLWISWRFRARDATRPRPPI